MAFLVYLWSWLIFWALLRFDLLPDAHYETVRAILSVVYLPFFLLGGLINWFR